MIMKTNRTFTAWIAPCGLLLAVSTLVARDVEDRLSQSYQVKPGGNLAVEADRGSIEVKSADGDQVAIEVLRKVSRESRARAEEVLKNHEVKFTQDGDTVQVRAELNSGWNSNWRDKGRNLQVRFLISVPKKFNVDLKTSGGSIKVSLSDKVAVDVDAKTSGGGVRTELPVAAVVQGEHRPNVLQGKINGG